MRLFQAKLSLNQASFILAFIISFLLQPSAQEIVWLKRFDTGRLDYLATGNIDSWGNLIIVGVTGDYGTRDITLIKYNPYGETLWMQTYNSGGDDVCLGSTVASDGGVVVGGRSSPSFYLIAKYGNNGDLEWAITDTISGSYLSALNAIISRDSLIYGTGKTISYEAKEDWFFVRFSADGRLLQREIFDLGYTDCEEIFRFVNCPDGNFVGVGTVGEGLPPILDIIILKFTSDGDTIWSRLVNIKPQDEAHDITIDSDGNLYITGDVYEDWGQGIVQPDSFVTARYRLDGRHEWGRVFGLCDYSWGEAIAFDPSGQVLVAGGSYDSILNESSGAILCYSPEGRLNWHWRFRQENWNCWFDDIVIIEPGVCYLIGEVANAEYDSSDFLVIKLRYPLGIAEGKGRKQKAADFSLSNPLKFGEPLRFSVPLPGDYRLTAFDASGRRVAEVYSGPLGSGTTNLGLASVPPGVYLLRMESEDYSAQTKLVIVP